LIIVQFPEILSAPISITKAKIDPEDKLAEEIARVVIVIIELI
jgi:hypothetical protein